MPAAQPHLQKCAEIFRVQSSKLFIYKCCTCLDFFGTHLECEQHVLNSCPIVEIAAGIDANSEKICFEPVEYLINDDEYAENVQFGSCLN